MATIPTTEEVAALTKATVDEATVDAAVGIIETFSGRPPDVWDQLRHRDRRHLKMAVSYQAAWLASHPEAFSTMDADSFSQLDQSVSLRDAASAVLAPLAARALKRLSWRGVRSVSVTTDFQSGPTDHDHAGYWSAL